MSDRPSSRIKIWVLAARPKTLFAAAAPVIVGTALAIESGRPHWISAVLAMTGALLIQIGTNLYNDYADFKKGADNEDRKGPLRVTQAGWVTMREIRNATVLTFALAVLSGLYLIYRGGWPIALIGTLSILCGVLYTAGRHSLAYLGLGDLFVLLFFGPVAVGGTYYVQTLDITSLVLLAGLGPGLLSVAILLVNNIRDIDEDRKARKRTLVVRFGRSAGIVLYVVAAVGAAVVPIIMFLANRRHPWVLLAVAVLAMAIPVIRSLILERDPAGINPLLGATGGILFLYSLMLSIGWNL